VHGTEVALDPRDRLLHLPRVADVARVAARPTARRLDLLGRLGGALGVEVRDRDLTSLGGERERVGLAEAPRPARDQRDPVANAQIHPYLPSTLGARLAKEARILPAAP